MEDMELAAAMERAKEIRDARVRERDIAAGIDITEDEILEKVDLNDLDLEDEASDEHGADDNEEEWEDA